ncbi:hypothetical protein PLICRDRAFT_126632 [Plicaturopsis crispa FD-325 SS-3]|uniref:Unplaced genomic scaffold PLICRscaffold_16, whole genome shotgun sequence n=1 Tax=Plicaturopsis crispa FD-325 SS-3 TaxID=944288 RepID=A0A0C9SY40_PLICR|nr:hypothetical protein PLICRDRAFT_126632 [Plicaturopsis crispa FD-325 SS-3]
MATTRTTYVAQHTPTTSTSSFTGLAPDSPASPHFPPTPIAPSTAKGEWTQVPRTGVQKLKDRASALIARNTGLLLVTASQALFSATNVAVKKLNDIDPPVPTLELVLVRMGITWIFCVSYMMYAKVPHPFTGPPGVRLLLVLRGFSGFFGLFGMYYSLSALSLSDATVITFIAPVLTGLVGAALLGETWGISEAAAGGCSLLGVVLIARPPFLFGAQPPSISDVPSTEFPSDIDGPAGVTPAERMAAVGVAMIGVLGATGAYTTLRAVGSRAHPLHSLTSFSLQCVVAATGFIIALKVPLVLPTRPDWILLLGTIGVTGFFAQVLLTMGLQRETAGRGTLGVYMQIVFATILERIFFHPAHSWLSVIGTLIIVASAVYVAVSKKAVEKSKPGVSGDAALEEGEGLLSSASDTTLDGDDEAILLKERGGDLAMTNITISDDGDLRK